MRRVSPAGALIGRDSEMALLAGLVKQAARGNGGLVLIEVEPASASPRWCGRLWRWPQGGCQVFWGAGDELSQSCRYSRSSTDCGYASLP